MNSNFLRPDLFTLTHNEMVCLINTIYGFFILCSYKILHWIVFWEMYRIVFIEFQYGIEYLNFLKIMHFKTITWVNINMLNSSDFYVKLREFIYSCNIPICMSALPFLRIMTQNFKSKLINIISCSFQWNSLQFTKQVYKKYPFLKNNNMPKIMFVLILLQDILKRA